MRPDKQGSHRASYDKNKRIILATQSVCGICGQPVDKSLKHGDPMAPCVDHIIPVAKGGHPSDIANLQLAHWSCNRAKSDKLFRNQETKEPKVIGNRNLPQSMDWAIYRSEE
jgi:5-methylcytosine-specific restriction endonuclease McrA